MPAGPRGPQPTKQRVQHSVTAALGSGGGADQNQSPGVRKEGLGGEGTQLSVLLRYLVTLIICNDFKVSFQEDPTISAIIITEKPDAA